MSIDDLKSLQKKIIKKNKTCNLISLIVLILLFLIISFVTFNYKLDIIFLLYILFFVFVFEIIITIVIKKVINGKDISEFRKEFKHIFVLDALNDCFDNLNYNFDVGFNENYIKSIGMMNTGDRFLSNDFISGIYKGIKFEQSDIHVEVKKEVKDSNGKEHVEWETIFQGRWMTYDFNKNFKSNIQVASSCFISRLLPYEKKFSKIEMEDSEFNKIFNVYTEMEHDAFYVLTPQFMEKLKKIYTELNSPIMFCFIDNRLHVAINNGKDSFEYNVFKEMDEKKIKESIIKDVKIITDFVNELNLDNDLFKEEV